MEALAERTFDEAGAVRLDTLGQSCANLALLAGLDPGRRGEGPRLAASRRPRGARPPPARAGEADAGARPRPVAVGGSRDRCVRADHRARRARAHVGRLRHRRGGDRPLRRDHPHRAHPRQRAHGGGCPRRDLQLDDADLLARVWHLGRVDDDRQRQLPQPAEPQDGVAPPGAAAVVPGSLGHLLQRGCPGEPRHCPGARSARCDRCAHRGARRGRPAPRPFGGREPPRVRRGRARAGRGAGARRRRGARALRPRSDRRRGRRVGDRRREGHAPVLGAPGVEPRRAGAPLPGRAQARGAISLPARAPHSPRRRAHHRRHRFRGLAGRGDHAGQPQAHPGRLLARPRHGGCRPSADPHPAAGRHRRHRHRRAHARTGGRGL